MRCPTSHGATTTPPSSPNQPITSRLPCHKRNRCIKAEVLDHIGHLGQFSSRNPLGKSVKVLRRSGSRSWCSGGCDKVIINGRLHAEHGPLFHRIPVSRWVFEFSSHVQGEQFFLIDIRCPAIIPSLGGCCSLFFCATATPAAIAACQDCHR